MEDGQYLNWPAFLMSTSRDSGEKHFASRSTFSLHRPDFLYQSYVSFLSFDRLRTNGIMFTNSARTFIQ